MARPKITLFVDIVSPFAYIGFYALRVCEPLLSASCTRIVVSNYLLDFTHFADRVKRISPYLNHATLNTCQSCLVV